MIRPYLPGETITNLNPEEQITTKDYLDKIKFVVSNIPDELWLTEVHHIYINAQIIF